MLREPANRLFSSFSSSSWVYTLIKPSNRSLEDATVKICSPAPIFTETVSYFAACIRLAVKRFQMSWYRRNKSLGSWSFMSKGIRLIAVGRMASWASWIFCPGFLSVPSPAYSAPYRSSIYSFAIFSASSDTRVESVRR